jgi:hypothetical protein
MLNKHNLSIAELCDRRSESRMSHITRNLHVTQDYTEATDGYVLIRVNRPQGLTASAFPEPRNGSYHLAGDAHPDILIPYDTALAALKALPKKSTIPILARAAITKTEVAPERVKYGLVVNDLERVSTFQACDTTAVYPDVARQIPAVENADYRITLSVDLVLRLAKTLEKLTNSAKVSKRAPRAVTLTFHNPKLKKLVMAPPGTPETVAYGPVRFDTVTDAGDPVVGALMTVREDSIDDWWRTKLGAAPENRP